MISVGVGSGFSRNFFVVAWALATTCGVAAGHLAADLLWFGLSNRWLFPLLPFGGAILGIPIGVLQWLVLRRRVASSTAWMLAAAAGWAGSWAVGSLTAVVIASSGGNARFFVAMACGTPIVGFAERHFLREWSKRAESWVMVSTAGWLAFMATAIFGAGWFAPVNAIGSEIVNAITGYGMYSTIGATIAGGLALGVITGIGMARALESKTRIVEQSDNRLIHQ